METILLPDVVHIRKMWLGRLIQVFKHAEYQKHNCVMSYQDERRAVCGFMFADSSPAAPCALTF